MVFQGNAESLVDRAVHIQLLRFYRWRNLACDFVLLDALSGGGESSGEQIYHSVYRFALFFTNRIGVRAISAGLINSL